MPNGETAKVQPLLINPVTNPTTTPSEQLVRGEPKKAGGGVGQHRGPVRKLGGGADPAFERFLMEHRGRRGPTSAQGRRGAEYFGYTGGDYKGQTPGQGDAAAGAEWRGMDITARREYAQKGETDDEFGFRLDREKQRAKAQNEVARKAAKRARRDELKFAEKRAQAKTDAEAAARASVEEGLGDPPAPKKTIFSGIKSGIKKIKGAFGGDKKPPVTKPSPPEGAGASLEERTYDPGEAEMKIAKQALRTERRTGGRPEGGGSEAQPPVAKTAAPKSAPSVTSERAAAAAKRAAKRAKRGAGLG